MMMLIQRERQSLLPQLLFKLDLLNELELVVHDFPIDFIFVSHLLAEDAWSVGGRSWPLLIQLVLYDLDSSLDRLLADPVALKVEGHVLEVLVLALGDHLDLGNGLLRDSYEL